MICELFSKEHFIYYVRKDFTIALNPFDTIVNNINLGIIALCVGDLKKCRKVFYATITFLTCILLLHTVWNCRSMR